MDIELSIIVPVYNTANYLEDCLNSIVDLNIENYEIIIVNDGSTDDSEVIIEQFQKKYSYIKYFYQENRGQGNARNNALKISNGKYIYFMDSDDILLKEQFLKCFEKLNSNNLEGVFFDGDVFLDSHVSSKSASLKKFVYSRKIEYGIRENGEKLFIDFIKNKELFVSPCLYIVSRDTFVKNKLNFPEGIKNEDEFFTTKLLFVLGKCAHVNIKAFNRRVRENSTMTSLSIENSYKYHITLMEYFDKFYQEHDFITLKGKLLYLKKFRNIYFQVLNDQFQMSKKMSFSNKNIIRPLVRKYKYFGIIGYIASKNYSLYRKIFKLLRGRIYDEEN